MTDAIAVVTDLIFSSKIVGTARALGIDAQAVTNAEALEAQLAEGGVRLVMVDMSLPGDTAVLSLRQGAAHPTTPTMLAFYSHVQNELVAEAESAGATLTMPRSKFSAELPAILKRFCSNSPDTSKPEGLC
ncbi:MAG: hypothetical protein IH987_19130 [Planctomycetes bacterium]|nr:hypothetical protein [Planctomycetota bacterium]